MRLYSPRLSAYIDSVFPTEEECASARSSGIVDLVLCGSESWE